jgi:hypothetical protein
VQEGLLDLCFLTKQLIAKDKYTSFSGNSFQSQHKTKGSMAGFSTTRLLPTLQASSDIFGNRIISSGIWSAHSPNLNPCDLCVV